MTILYHKTGAVTASALSKSLGIRKVRDNKWKPADGVPTIRWGSSMPVPNDTCVLNPASAIKTTADGIKMLQVLREAGVNVPESYVVSSEEQLPKDVHLFARKKNHVGGTDIIDCPTYDDAVVAFREHNRRFFTQYVDTAIELRLHVIDGEVVKAFRKHNDDETAIKVRSAKQGWAYKMVNVYKYYPLAIPVALATIKALGLTFGAVDMACDESRSEWVVWEANSAPSLNSLTLELYVQFFERKLNDR